jgi:orotidine-5'-phosphate decarboxylase
VFRLSHFADLTYKAIKEKNTALVVGLDPIPQQFPDFLRQGENNRQIAQSIYEFNKIVIDNVVDFAVAVKPQLAYYEIFGSEGIRALENTVAYAKSIGMIVVNDGKRNDIGSTADAYAEAYLGCNSLSGDALTVNPYLGSDGIVPFIKKAKENGKGIFSLLKTSNPSSGEIQDLVLNNGKPFYMELADRMNKWSEETVGKCGYSYLGAVVGATYPEIAIELRKMLPNTIFLVPGFGAQGGKAEDLKPFFDQKGFGALINSARGILYAYQKQVEEWEKIGQQQMGQIIQHAAKSTAEQINSVRLSSVKF